MKGKIDSALVDSFLWLLCSVPTVHASAQISDTNHRESREAALCKRSKPVSQPGDAW